MHRVSYTERAENLRFGNGEAIPRRGFHPEPILHRMDPVSQRSMRNSALAKMV